MDMRLPQLAYDRVELARMGADHSDSESSSASIERIHPRRIRRGGGGGGRLFNEAVNILQIERQEPNDRVYDAPGSEPEVKQYVESPAKARVLKELGTPNEIDKCFACRMIRSPEKVTPVCRKGVQLVLEVIETCENTDEVTLCHDLEILFELKVRAPANNWRRPGEAECPPWKAVDIYEHYFTPRHGFISARSSINKRIREFETMKQDWNDLCVYTMGTNSVGEQVRVPDPQKMKMSIELSKVLDRLYAMRSKETHTVVSSSSFIRPTVGELPTTRQ